MTTVKEATPALREESIWAAGNLDVAKTLPYAAPFISPEDEYLARQRAQQTATAQPKATP